MTKAEVLEAALLSAMDHPEFYVRVAGCALWSGDKTDHDSCNAINWWVRAVYGVPSEHQSKANALAYFLQRCGVSE